MEEKFTISDSDGTQQELISKEHPEWNGLGEQCPECGETEYRHFRSEGIHLGLQNDALVQRTDFWDSNRTLLTQCMSCETVLEKHPAFDLLYDGDNDED